jgi:hypothetical protein
MGLLVWSTGMARAQTSAWGYHAVSGADITPFQPVNHIEQRCDAPTLVITGKTPADATWATASIGGTLPGFPQCSDSPRPYSEYRTLTTTAQPNLGPESRQVEFHLPEFGRIHVLQSGRAFNVVSGIDPPPPRLVSTFGDQFIVPIYWVGDARFVATPLHDPYPLVLNGANATSSDGSWLQVLNVTGDLYNQPPGFFSYHAAHATVRVLPNAGAERTGSITVDVGDQTIVQPIVQQGTTSPGQITIAVQQPVIVPSGAAASSTTAVTIACTNGAGQPIACAWQVALSGEDASDTEDGHTPAAHIGSRPLGGLTSQNGTCGTSTTRNGNSDAATGQSVIRLCAPQVSGTLTLKATATSGGGTPLAPAEALVAVRIDGLVNLAITANLEVLHVKFDPQHPGRNGWGTPALAARLLEAGRKYAQQTGKRLGLSDVGLPWGGLFDDDGLWAPPHSAHRTGINADVRIRDPLTVNPLSAADYRHLEAALRGAKFLFPVAYEAPTVPGQPTETHWHIQLPASAGSPATLDAVMSTAMVNAAAVCPAGPNQVTFGVSATIVPEAVSGLRYRYIVQNFAGSLQPVESWQIEVAGLVTDVVMPQGWTAVVQQVGTSTVVHWYAVAPETSAVAPGASLDGFGFTSAGFPADAVARAFGLVAPSAPLASHDEAEALIDTCPDTWTPPAIDAVGPAPASVVVRRYLAEGATGTFFETSLALLNPGTSPAAVVLRFLKDDGTSVGHHLTIPAGTRRTVRPASLAGLESANFSTVIESDALVVVDRTMTWGGGYGSHAETALDALSPTWYLAEGSTAGDFFNLFYLLQNPHATPVDVTIRYLRPFGQPAIEKPYTLPANSRTTLYVDEEHPQLANTDVSSVVTASAPIIVERAMYVNKPNQPFAAGHESAGVTAPALEWFLAEGATGPFFDLFVLIANPGDTDAQVTADYLLLGGGKLTKSYTVPANGRFTIWVDDEELPAGSGLRPLANVAVSTAIRSTNAVPVIVERAMWWPGSAIAPDFWYEAHNSPGATVTGTRWALAEGEVGGATALETYVLIANTSAVAGQARVTLLFEDGTTAKRTCALEANSRTNVPIGLDFPTAVGRRFGTIVESLGATPALIVVERAMYADFGGRTWSAGSNALATRLP